MERRKGEHVRAPMAKGQQDLDLRDPDLGRPDRDTVDDPIVVGVPSPVVEAFLHHLLLTARATVVALRDDAGTVVARSRTGRDELSRPVIDLLAEALDQAAVVRADGSLRTRPGLTAAVAVPLDDTGVVSGAMVVVRDGDRLFDDRDIAELQSAAALASHLSIRLDPSPSLAMCQQVIDALPVAVVVADDTNEIVWANAEAHQILEGTDLSEAMNRDRSSAIFETPSGRQLSERIAPLVDPERAEIIGTIRTFADVTERENERDRLEALVHTDPLTGVANRRSIERKLRRHIARTSVETCVGIMDLDRFKLVNDQLGHQVGDDTLVAIVDAVRAALGNEGVIGRLGGDEFALIIDGDLRSAKRLALAAGRAIRQAMSSHRDVRADLSASVGLTAISGSDSRPSDVLRRADEACYLAKRRRDHIEIVRP